MIEGYFCCPNLLLQVVELLNLHLLLLLHLSIVVLIVIWYHVPQVVGYHMVLLHSLLVLHSILLTTIRCYCSRLVLSVLEVIVTLVALPASYFLRSTSTTSSSVALISSHISVFVFVITSFEA